MMQSEDVKTRDFLGDLFTFLWLCDWMLPTKKHHGNCSLLHMFSSTAWKPLHFFNVSQIEIMNRKS